jgi:hypothetical protein
MAGAVRCATAVARLCRRIEACSLRSEVEIYPGVDHGFAFARRAAYRPGGGVSPSSPPGPVQSSAGASLRRLGRQALSTPPERDGCFDEGAGARRGLGCAECDGELHLLSKVGERPEYDLREAQSAHGLRHHRHAVAGGGHAERRYEIADVVDDLDREPASSRQPLEVAT